VYGQAAVSIIVQQLIVQQLLIFEQLSVNILEGPERPDTKGVYMDWATKDNFFKAKVPVEEMDVPTIGRVKIHGLGLGEKEDWEKSSFKVNVEKNDLTISNADAQLLMLTVHNQHGQKLFTDKDMGRMLVVPAVYLEPVLETARKLSGIGKQAVKDLVKNLPEAQGPEEKDSSTD